MIYISQKSYFPIKYLQLDQFENTTLSFEEFEETSSRCRYKLQKRLKEKREKEKERDKIHIWRPCCNLSRSTILTTRNVVIKIECSTLLAYFVTDRRISIFYFRRHEVKIAEISLPDRFPSFFFSSPTYPDRSANGGRTPI